MQTGVGMGICLPELTAKTCLVLEEGFGTA